MVKLHEVEIVVGHNARFTLTALEADPLQATARIELAALALPEVGWLPSNPSSAATRGAGPAQRVTVVVLSGREGGGVLAQLLGNRELEGPGASRDLTRANVAPVNRESVRELLLRVAASLAPGRAEQMPDLLNQAVTIGALRLARHARRVWVDGEEVSLTLLELRLLEQLSERPDVVHTRESLLRSVWGRHATGTTRTVDTHVKRLRQKLKAAGRYIQTVRGFGYRFEHSDRP